MKYRLLALTLLSCAFVIGFQATLMGQIFFTDSFDYPDGDLTVVSNGDWVTHSGAPLADIQVVSGNAVISAPGEEDDSRLTGAIMGVNDVWYYAVRFSVQPGDATLLNQDYFIHFKDDTSFGYNARLAIADPADAANDFSLEIWASSGSDGKEPWLGDFSFGEEIIAVVRWNNGTGEATLWVNPVDINSTNVTDDELPDAMRAVETLALRQDGQDGDRSSVVTAAVVSCGTDFDAVLAEVQPATSQIFFTDSFDYPDGDLTVVSNGDWVTHSGAPLADIQVVSGNAVISAPGEEDDSRLTGAIMGVNDVWYYSVRFSVEPGDATLLNQDYFIHFKDDTTFGYNARLAIADPADAANDFSLEIWASSGSDGKEPWLGDFSFGEEIIAVVRWNNGTGEATLWVNPVDISSTNVTDDELPDAMRAVETLALRQDGQDGDRSSVVTVAVVSCGTDFDAVLAEVQPTGGPVIVVGETLDVMPGIISSGGLSELATSDNSDLGVFRDPGSVSAVTQFELTATSPTASPTTFDFTLEGNCVSRPNVVQRIQLFDYVAGAYETVDERNANRTPNPDLTVTVSPGGDLSRFVDQTTSEIKARVRYRADIARAGFAANTDQAVWTIE